MDHTARPGSGETVRVAWAAGAWRAAARPAMAAPKHRAPAKDRAGNLAVAPRNPNDMPRACRSGCHRHHTGRRKAGPPCRPPAPRAARGSWAGPPPSQAGGKMQATTSPHHAQARLPKHEKGPGIAAGASQNQPRGTVYFMVTAWRPRCPSRTSRATFSPCCTSCLPARCSTEECRKTSWPPSSGVTKPKPRT